MPYIPLRKAVEFLGMSANTLRKYADEGKIKSIKNQAGQRLYDVESYTRGDSIRTTTVCYCRVSSSKQRDDLDRLLAYMQSLYPEAEIIRDIGSGINFKRKGLRSLLERLMRGNKLMLIVACHDRLARFGFELFQFMVEQNGEEIMVLDQAVHCPESELTQDLLSILHVFSCRMLTLSHYQFKQFFKDKAFEYNKVVVDVNEAYTSKTVSWSGEVVKNLGGSKTIKSPFTLQKMDRDLNGARGIFLRALVDTPWLAENLVRALLEVNLYIC